METLKSGDHVYIGRAPQYGTFTVTSVTDDGLECDCTAEYVGEASPSANCMHCSMDELVKVPSDWEPGDPLQKINTKESTMYNLSQNIDVIVFNLKPKTGKEAKELREQILKNAAAISERLGDAYWEKNDGKGPVAADIKAALDGILAEQKKKDDK